MFIVKLVGLICLTGSSLVFCVSSLHYGIELVCRLVYAIRNYKNWREIVSVGPVVRLIGFVLIQFCVLGTLNIYLWKELLRV